MENSQHELYYKGYIAGYRNGMKDAAAGKTLDLIESDVANLPIEEMRLSTRAYNCLSRAGCVYIADVVALRESTVAAMRNLGGKTALEIARSLDAHGISYSGWSNHL